MPINKDKDILHFLSINMHKPKIPIWQGEQEFTSMVS